ncbi:MAG: LacI family DNA-binding transcriptional regulator [Verrucomicrobiota bacterium JB024]|nr:LacI family DNA-binding transcriptional regulator [Verrucomicrobiota bacterium JB024]
MNKQASHETITKENVTLTDVAREAGVSQATVSRVINKYPQITERTRLKVYQAAESLGYKLADAERRSTQNGRRFSVCLLLCPLQEQIDMLSLDYFNRIVAGMHGHFDPLGNVDFSLQTWQVGRGGHADNERLLERLERIDGFLITGNPEVQLLERLRRFGKSFVCVSTNRDDFQIDSVNSDNVYSGKLAARYLISHGYRRVGWLGGPRHIYSWSSRKMGVLFEVLSHSDTVSFSFRDSPSTEVSDMAGALHQWMDEKDFPEALVLPCNTSVNALERVMVERGLKAPRDLGFITFDKPMGTFCSPAYIETFPEQVGMKSAQRIMEIIRNGATDEIPHQILVPTSLVEGDSVQPLRGQA